MLNGTNEKTPYIPNLDGGLTFGVSVDCVIFGYKKGKLKVLLIKRNAEPFTGSWALPGDLVEREQDIDDSASFVLKSLTQCQ